MTRSSDPEILAAAVAKLRAAALAYTRARSGYRGVFWDGTTETWRAEIGFYPTGTRRRLGHFPSAEAAARAYDKAARELYRDEARLNFPNDAELPVIREDEYLADACTRGHHRAVYGYFHEKRQRWNCRECNRLAVARYKARKVSRRAAPI